jgi:hypothetical protein
MKNYFENIPTLLTVVNFYRSGDVLRDRRIGSEGGGDFIHLHLVAIFEVVNRFVIVVETKF